MIFESVAQPLHDGAGDEDAALERELAPARQLPRDGGHEVVRRGDALLPVFSSMKQPVPYVFFPSPGEWHACPNSAAC